MINLTSANITKAIERAKQCKPFVSFESERSFKVVSRRSGNTYNVKFEKHGRNKYGECTCKAGQHNQVCYHLVSAASVNIAVQSQRAN